MSAVSWSLGAQPAVVVSIEDRAEQLREVAAILRRHGGTASLHVAGAFETLLAQGGDLRELLGVRVRPGRACDVPATRHRRHERDDAVRALAATLPGKPTARANAIAAMLLARDGRVTVIHQTTEALPASVSQLKRILRGA